MNAPKISFLVGGVQKAGTTALAAHLGSHPSIRLPRSKEAHVFDAPDYHDDWGIDEIDQRFAKHFKSDDWPMQASVLYGDATPIYIMHPLLMQRIHGYNPMMKWILILRDPAERAYSHYMMEKSRGNESLPLWPALMLEPLRLRGHRSDFSADSPLRTHSYRWRGDYRRQLRQLFALFGPAQVLLLDARTLAASPQQTLDRVTAFLGLDPVPDAAALRRFEGGYRPLSSRPVLRFCLASMMRSERRDYRRLRDLAYDADAAARWANDGTDGSTRLEPLA